MSKVKSSRWRASGFRFRPLSPNVGNALLFKGQSSPEGEPITEPLGLGHVQYKKLRGMPNFSLYSCLGDAFTLTGYGCWMCRC